MAGVVVGEGIRLGIEASEACAAAIEDAGLDPSQIDGLTTFTLDTSDEIEVARAVGMGELTFMSRVAYGGGAAIGVMHQAAMAVATGSAKYVCVYRDLNGRSGQRYSEGVGDGPTTSDLVHWSWYMPWGLMTPASWVAMFTTRYMHQSGAKSTDLAEIAVMQRSHAVNNPAAFFYQKPLTIEEHQTSRLIVEPLRAYGPVRVINAEGEEVGRFEATQPSPAQPSPVQPSPVQGE